MVLINSSKLKLSIESIFSSLNNSLSSSSLIFSPEFSITFLNSFFVKIEAKFEPYFSLSFKLKIDRIASINSYSDSGYLYLLRLFFEVPGHESEKICELELAFLLWIYNACPLPELFLSGVLI